MKDYTIAEDFTLPSLGKVYSCEVNPEVKIRAMTTEDEMRRLSRTNKPHKLLCEIIDDCLVEKPGISSYDMCLADQQFLLHKLRTVTYGPEYKVEAECPHCGSKNILTINLDELVCNQFTDDLKSLFEIDLPVTKKHIKLRLQTPRMLEDVDAKTKEAQRKHPNAESEPAFLFYVISSIDEVDGQHLDGYALEDFVRKLPMRDTNYITQKLNKLTESFGINLEFNTVCSVCGLDYKSYFRTSSEFFRPTMDE